MQKTTCVVAAAASLSKSTKWKPIDPNDDPSKRINEGPSAQTCTSTMEEHDSGHII